MTRSLDFQSSTTMPLPNGLTRIFAIVIVLAALLVAWRLLEPNESVWISVDSYSTHDSELLVLTTAFNKLERKVTLRAVVQAVTTNETRMGSQITSSSQKHIVLSVNARSKRKDQFTLPSPQGMGSIAVHVIVLHIE